MSDAPKATEPVTNGTPKVTIEPIARYQPQRRNANRHTPRGLGMLETAMQTDGFVAPMTAANDGEVIDGSARLEKAATVFGDEVLVIEHDGTRPIIMKRTDIPNAQTPEAKRISVAANRIAAVDLDFDAEMLAEIEEQTPGLLAGLFSEQELDDVFQEAKLGQEQEPSGEEPEQVETDRFQEVAEKWKTSDSQIWQLGRHKILCGDCLDPDNIKRLLGDTVPDLILADPPYGVNIVATNVSVGGGEAYNIPFGGRKKGYVGGGNSIKDRTGHYPIEKWRPKGLTGTDGASKPFGSKAVRGTDGAAHVVEVGKYPVVIGDENTDVAEQAVTLYCDLYPKAVQVWWGANYYSPILPASMCWVVWNKETTGNFADCELAWTNQNKAAKLFTHRWNGMLRDSERERRWHPTQKPAALAAWVYGEFVKEDAVIVDPFAGAGWSVLGGEQSNRTVFAMEKSHEYIAVILERWSLMTGQVPILLP